MKTPGWKIAQDHAAEGERPAQNTVAVVETSIFDALSADDRASIERGLAQSLAGIHSTDDEVEAAFAVFRR